MVKICNICKDPIQESNLHFTRITENSFVNEYECYECHNGPEENEPEPEDDIPTCDKCCAEEGLIIFGEDEEKQTICYGCLQDAVDNGACFIQLDQ